MSENDAQTAEIAAYTDTAAGIEEANAILDASWIAILADPAKRAEVATLLELDPAALPEQCPFTVRGDRAGMSTADYVIVCNLALLFAKEVAWDLAKDLAKDAVKAAARAVWDKVVLPEAEEDLPYGGLGRERPPADDVQ